MNRIVLGIVYILFLSININAQEATNENVTELYIATFDRAPDSAGLKYWVNDSGLSLESIAMSFFDQDETKAEYPSGTSNGGFVDSIYSNLFKRTPDTSGVEYWIGELDRGSFSKSLFILAVVNGATGDDASILNNKTGVGLAFVKSSSTDMDLAKDIMKYVDADRQTVVEALGKLPNNNDSNDDTVNPSDIAPLR